MPEPKKRPFSFDKLGKLEKGLYAREPVAKGPEGETTEATAPTSDVSSDWNDATAARPPVSKYFKIDMRVMKKILWGAGLFFVMSLGIGAVIFFGGLNRISTDNVDIAITGPSSIGAGEPLSFGLVMHNQNNIDLEGVTLLVEYPPGTRTADENKSSLLSESEPLGTVATGASIKRDKQAILFGEADSTQHIIVSVEYRVKDSSATYFKEKYYEVLISTAPVRMKIDSVTEATTGNEVEISVEVVSNSTSLVSGLLLKVDYPFGFNFTSAVPSPLYGNNVFVLGDLKPADRRVIRIRGTLTGQEGEDRTFRFNLGLPDKKDVRAIGTAFLTSTQSIVIKKPFVSAVLSLDGSAADPYAIEAGQLIQGQIAWANNLPSRIIDLEIQAKLIGDSLNRLSVTANQGFYRSLDNVIVWDKTTSGQFSVVEPGENGILSFSLASLPVTSLLYTGLRGNEISIEVSVKARRLSDANVPEDVVSGASQKIRLSSNVGVAGRSLYATGPFQNQGPIPPQADRNTTYTIVWSVTNTLNDLSGVQVSATLPGYVQWLNNVSPSGESITFDPQAHQVLWDVGDVRAGTGFTSSVREASFQVSVVPSLSQLGDKPVLVGPAAITGTDRFSNAEVKSNAKEVTTAVSDVSQFDSNNGRVTQ